MSSRYGLFSASKLVPETVRVRRPSLLQYALLVTSLLTAARFLVLFAESYSLVSSERAADVDLLKLCSAGAAADSTKFRALCLKARSESAAPLILKALLKSFKTAFADFSESFNSPSRVAMLVLFCLSGLALPIVKAASKLATMHFGPKCERLVDAVHGVRFADSDEDDDHQASNRHVVVLDSERRGLVSTIGAKLRRLPARRKRLLTISDDDECETATEDRSYVPLEYFERAR